MNEDSAINAVTTLHVSWLASRHASMIISSMIISSLKTYHRVRVPTIPIS